MGDIHYQRLSPEAQQQVNDRSFRELMDFFMAADPWPYSDELHEKVEGVLNSCAQNRGYDDWTVAYHEFRPQGRRLRNRMPIVLLIGSSSMREQYIRAMEQMARAGKVPVGLTPVKSRYYEEFVRTHENSGAQVAKSEAEVRALSEYKWRLLDIADEVFVINFGGYIGEDTDAMIKEAVKRGIPVSFLEDGR